MDSRSEHQIGTNSRKIFIIYCSAELNVAEALRALLTFWGLEPFFCRREDVKSAAKETYRKILREKLMNSDLAILLVSKEFQWSPYCQAEAGSVMAKNIPRILLTIPPARSRDVEHISPVLEGYNSLYSDVNCIDNLALYIDQDLDTGLVSKRSAHTVEERGKEQVYTAKLYESIKQAEDFYRLSSSSETHRSKVWPSMNDPHMRASLVGNIVASLRSENNSNLVFVGVSLKFSLRLIWEALMELTNDISKGRATHRGNRKCLSIELVHMDHCSHILQTLNDTIDLPIIRENFHRSWNQTKEEWGALCSQAGIILSEPTTRKISYIPPRVGVLIDDRILYSGDCSVLRNADAYQLLVGENEYALYFLEGGERDRTHIKQFQSLVQTYRDAKHNAGWLVSDENNLAWILELQRYIRCCPEGTREIQLLSKSGRKFLPLLKPALERGIQVHFYIQRPGSDEDRSSIAQLERNIQAEAGNVRASVVSKPEIHYYWPESTFRAAVIGNDVLGIQMYMSIRRSDDGIATQGSQELTREMYNSPLRLVLGNSSVHFDEMKSMVEQFIQSNCCPKA